MSLDHCGLRAFLRATFILALLSSATATALTQAAAKPSSEKWRPKEGVYAAPGADFSPRCGEDGDFIIELRDNSISGNEWSCEIKKLTDTAPDAIRLDMTCNDYNLALFINEHDPNAYERKFEEVMLLRKIDGKSVYVRKTLNGKFKDPDWRASYCPEQAQRMHAEARARQNAEAEQQAMEESSRSNPWRPRDGVYAAPGTDFNERCMKFGDAIIELAERSISKGADTCNVTFIRDEPNAIRLFATCRQRPNLQGSTARIEGGRSVAVLRSSETIILRKNGDNTIFMQKSENDNFTDPGEKLSYCGADAQRKFALQKARK